MSNKIENLDIKLNALEEAISYPSLKKQAFGDACIIEVETFDYDIIRQKIKDNEKLTNLEGTKMDLILEVLKLLNDYKIKYNVELHNIIGFYFRGLLLLVLKVTGNQVNNQDRMIYVSVKVYKDELNQSLSDKKLSRYVAGIFVGLLLIGGAWFATKIMRDAVK